MRLVQSWPRDERGRLAARTTAILAAYGPATRKRQPCLLIRSAMQSKMPGWELLLSQEFLYNQRHQWSDSPWLWTAQPAPPTSRLEQQARKLMAQGKMGEACELCGVQLGEKCAGCPQAWAFSGLSLYPRLGRMSCAWPCCSWLLGGYPQVCNAFNSTLNRATASPESRQLGTQAVLVFRPAPASPLGPGCRAGRTGQALAGPDCHGIQRTPARARLEKSGLRSFKPLTKPS